MTKRYTINISDDDFAQWIKAHPDCEELVLVGKIDANKHKQLFEAIEKALSEQKLKAFDITDLNVEEYPQFFVSNSDDDNDYSDEDDDEDDDEDNDFPHFKILKQIICNLNHAKSFVWCGDALLSSDLRVLVYHKQINPIVIPQSVEVIGKHVFNYNGKIEKLTLPENLKAIDESAFQGCYDLSFDSLPKTLTYLGECAFYDCDFNKIDIPFGVETIPECCFAYNLLAKITLPTSVKKICKFAFENCSNEVWLPEGVETVEYGAFGNVRFIHFPSTAKEIDPRFHIDEDGDGHIPYIDVAIGNPYFYDAKGTLYKIGEIEPYIGERFVPDLGNKLLLSTSDFVRDKVYSLNELKERYYSVSPINANSTLFLVWNGKERYYNIVDRYGNEYLNKQIVTEVDVSFNRFVIVNKSAVYSVDMKELLLDASLLEYDIKGCDDEGRIYVSTGYEVDEFYLPLFPDQQLPLHWCIDINGVPLLKNKYNGLGHFDSQGLAPAAMGKLWGMIDTEENVVVPFAYKSVGHFDNEGMAQVAKGNKKGYIDRNANIVIPICYDFVYKDFKEDNYAYVENFKGKDIGGYFIDRKGVVLGKFQPRNKYEGIYSPGIHIFFNGCKYGYCKQFARQFSGCIYESVRDVDKNAIEVSSDGVAFQLVRC